MDSHFDNHGEAAIVEPYAVNNGDILRKNLCLFNNTVNGIKHCISEGVEPKVLDDILHIAEDIYLQHFAYQERLMDHCSFAGVDRHKRHHEDLQEQFEQFKRVVLSGDLESAAEKITALSKRVDKHLENEDQPFIDFLEVKRPKLAKVISCPVQ